jgi:membrane protease YdiL (CAAX protease family)
VNGSNSTISPAWPTHWPKDSFTGILAWALAGIIVGVVAVVAFASAAPAPSAHAIRPSMLILLIALQSLLEAGLVAAILLALPRIARLPLRELGFTVPTLPVIGTALLGALAMIVVADGGASLVDKFTHGDHQQQSVEIFRALHDRSAITVFASFAIVFAPIAEETIFRVFVFNFGLRYGGFWLGAPISGLLFGLAHGDAFAALPLGLGGIVLCAVYYRTRNAFASMITHGVFNAFSILALLLAPRLVSP